MNGVKSLLYTGIAFSTLVAPSLSVTSVLLEDSKISILDNFYQKDILPTTSEFKSSVVSFEESSIEIDSDIPVDNIKMNYNWVKTVDTSNWL